VYERIAALPISSDTDHGGRVSEMLDIERLIGSHTTWLLSLSW